MDWISGWMLRGGEIIDQIKCYDDFSKRDLLMKFFYTKHMSVSYVGWTKLMAYSFLVFIYAGCLCQLYCAMCIVCILFFSSSCVATNHVLINYKLSRLAAIDSSLFSISSCNSSWRIVPWNFPFFGFRTTYLYVTI